MITLNLPSRYLVLGQFAQTITFAPKVGEGSYAPSCTVSGCFWAELGQEDFQRSPALLQKTSRAVHIWSPNLSGYVVSGNAYGPVYGPKMDDKITDAVGDVWYAEQVEYLDVDASGVNRYRVTCYKDPS